MNEIKTGEYNVLKVSRIMPQGAYLADELGQEVLMPRRYVSELLKLEDSISVFVYLDSEDRLVATTETPSATVGQVTWLEIAEVNMAGAFAQWGLVKQLLIPFAQQHAPLSEGRFYATIILKDEQTDRLIGSTKLRRFIKNEDLSVSANEQVDILLLESNSLGYKAVVNNRHWGMLYHNQIFSPVHSGQALKAFVRHIRPDNLLDLSLQLEGYKEAMQLGPKFLDILEKAGGFLPITDKSDPEIIYQTFQLSKKSFKKIVGTLYKQRQIVIEAEGIRLIPSE